MSDVSRRRRPSASSTRAMHTAALLVAAMFAAIALSSCGGDDEDTASTASIASPAPTASPTAAATTGAAGAVGRALDTRDLPPDPTVVAVEWMLFGVTGAPLEAEADALFTDSRSPQHPLQLDFPLSETAVQENDLGDVLKVPFTARFTAPRQDATTFLELYVLVDDGLVGTSRYPSTGYLEEVPLLPSPVSPGDFVSVTSAVYVGSALWGCDQPQRVIELEVIAVIWGDSGRRHENGPWDGGPADGLWSEYRSIRGSGATGSVDGATRLSFDEQSSNFLVGMPFFALVDETDDESHVAHAGSFEHVVSVWEEYWDYPVEPSKLVLFPSDEARMTLNGFEAAGLWVGGAESTVLSPPRRDDFGVVVGRIRHTGPEHLEIAFYDTLWSVTAAGQNTLFRDEPDIAAEFLFDWLADEVPIGDERLCNDEFNVSDVSPPPTATPPSTPVRTPTPTPTPTPPSIPVLTPTPTPTPTEPPAVTLTGGTFDVIFVIASDPAGHAPFIGSQPSTLTVTVAGETITIAGSGAFVGVSGSLTDDGSFVASGSGTVAGFTNVGVSFNGTLEADGVSGTYTMGTGGELPQGLAAEYSVQ